MATYVRIKELSGKENANLIKVLKYIAEKEGYLSCGNIQYRKLFNKFLKPKFIQVSRKYIFSNRSVSISRKQYNRLRVYVRGQFSINTAVYLIALYEIMLNYNEHSGLTPCIDDISYTSYIVNVLKREINTILNLYHHNLCYLSANDVAIFEQIRDDFIYIDNQTGGNSRKIYNNIW